MQEATRKVILRLKEIRAQKRLTYQEIVDACEAQNEAVSLSTIRRIFGKDSENGPDYRPYTINAIVHALIGTEEIELTAAEEAALTETEKEIITENSALRAAFDLNDAMIEDLHKQIESLTSENNSLRRTIEDMQIRLDTTNSIISMAMESFGKGASQ